MTPVAPPRRGTFDRLQTIARWLLPVYALGVLFGGAVVFGLYAYGLAHASGGAAGTFVGVLALGVLAALALPVLVLLPGTSAGMRTLKGVGMAVMALGFVPIGMATWYALLQPAWWTARFEHAMGALSIVRTEERALTMQGRQVGIRLVFDVRARRSIPLDRFGAGALGVIGAPTMRMVDVVEGSAQAPLVPRGALERVRVADGVPLESLPGISNVQGGITHLPARGAVLPAGEYRVTQDFWFVGLGADAQTGLPCREDDPDAAQRIARLASTGGRAMRFVVGTRLSLRDRLGYRHFTLESEPLQVRHDPARWSEDLARLALEGCSASVERRRQAERAERRARQERLFAAGDRRLQSTDNPLYEDLCDDDPAPLRRLVGAGVPDVWRVYDRLLECTIAHPRIEHFALMMPVLHARPEPKAEYCDVLAVLHSTRDLERLERIRSQGLPVRCDGARRQDWRKGVSPVDPGTGTRVRNPSVEDTLRWLRWLVAAKVPVCEPQPDEGTLLNHYAARGPVPILELLLQAGCDPHLRANADGRSDGPDPRDYTPSELWAMRLRGDWRYRHIVEPIYAGREPVHLRGMGDPGAPRRP